MSGWMAKNGDDGIITLLMIVGYIVLQVLSSRKKKAPPAAPPPDALPETPDSPAPRRMPEAATPEQQLRDFLDQLGRRRAPRPATTAPASVRRAQETERRDAARRPAMPSPAPVAAPSAMPAEPEPLSLHHAADSLRPLEKKVFAQSLSVASVKVPTARAGMLIPSGLMSDPTQHGSQHLPWNLAGAHGRRQAVVLREMLGPPRSLQPYGKGV